MPVIFTDGSEEATEFIVELPLSAEMLDDWYVEDS